jgi:hypothetical protein
MIIVIEIAMADVASDVTRSYRHLYVQQVDFRSFLA